MAVDPIVTNPASDRAEGTVNHSRFRRSERLADTLRRSLKLVTVTPDPPRGVRLSNGTAIWEAPVETRNVTHYNIYAPLGNNLERRVPFGQLKATALGTVPRVFVSAFNAYTGLESAAILAINMP